MEKIISKNAEAINFCNVSVLLESISASIVNLKDKHNSEEATKLLDPSISPEICVKNNFKQQKDTCYSWKFKF